MAQIFGSLTFDSPEHILCSYLNTSKRLQVVRLLNGPSSCFERVVFPQQRFLFAARPEDQLEVQSSSGGDIVSQTIASRCLRVPGSRPLAEAAPKSR